MKLNGSCHCGNVKWIWEKPLESVTACNCTLCRRYAALWMYGHLNEGISISGTASKYERNKKYNGFYFCNNCGCICYYLSNHLDSENRRRMAINVRMTEEVDLIQNLEIDHFEGLNKFEDEARDGRCVKDYWY